MEQGLIVVFCLSLGGVDRFVYEKSLKAFSFSFKVLVGKKIKELHLTI